jgi:ATPase subunit of ABC transporter with duplicated ATPase domains
MTRALKNDVLVTVDRAADTEAYRALLAKATARSGIRSDLLDAVAAQVRPRALLAAVEARDLAVIERVDPLASGKTKRADVLLDWLARSEHLHELETVRLGDVVRFALTVTNADGTTEPQPSETLSNGQRCTCVLPPVLMQSFTLLLLDQPEDQVDSGYIYRVLIPAIIAGKTDRQILIVTHDANLMVLANPERIFGLGGGRWSGRLDCFGDVEQMRGWIEAHVEGGREAFLRRAATYGHLPHATSKQ